MQYAMGWRNKEGELICVLYPDWPSVINDYRKLDELSKAVYKIVQGTNELIDASSEI